MFTLKNYPVYFYKIYSKRAELTKNDMTKYYFNVSNRPFAVSNRRHFTTMTKILEGFASLCKLGLLLFKSD